MRKETGMLLKNTVFVFYDPKKDLLLLRNGSNHAIDGVLQKANADILKHRCCNSRTLTANWILKRSIAEKEALSVV